MSKEELKKVLIVDDEEEVLRFLRKNLCNDSLHVEIITASSGEEALETLKGSEQIDLVITEIKMPGISGFDLLFEIKNRYPYTSVIVMTALPTNEYKREALLKGSLYFAEKPLDIDKLRGVVSRALNEGSMFEGTVAGLDLIDVILMKTMSRVSGALRVKEEDRQGIIYFDKGNIIHAIFDDLEGTEAFFRIMEFGGGILDDLKVADLPEQTIDIPTEHLLLQGVKHLDECKAGDEDNQSEALPDISEDTVVPEKLKKVLIVDDEEDMLWSLQRSLCNESLNVEVLVASSGEEALKIMNESEHIDLVITDIKMPGITGLDLLIEIKNRYPHTAVIVMTAFPSNEYKKEALLKGSLYFTEKPFDINDLRETIFRALSEDKMFKGTVAGVSLFDVIQIKFMSRVSGALRVKEGEKQGVIYFDEGRIIHAICDDLEGTEAFFRTIEFSGGILEDLKVTNLPDQTIDITTESLLLEGALHLDEIGAGNNTTEQEAIHDDEENDNREIVVQDNGSWQNLALKEEEMAELKEVLREFTNVPGVNTACLVGRDGFLLDSIAISGIDAEMIGAIASSGFGASESMGSQLGKGELSMSMIEFEEGPVMLSPVGADAFLVIVAEKDANLGMIRLKIKKYSAEIVETAGI